MNFAVCLVNVEESKSGLAVGAHVACCAVCAIGSRADLGRLGATAVAGVSVAVFGIILARVCNLTRVTIVRVDSAENTAIDGAHVVHFTLLVSRLDALYKDG